MMPAELVFAIATAIVKQTHRVEVIPELTTEGTLLRLCVAPEDIGSMIGRDGRNARAIRTLLAGISKREGHRYLLDIAELEPVRAR